MQENNGFNSDFKPEEIIEQMIKLFGDRLVDPEIFPKQFAYQAKFACHQLRLKKEGKLE